MQLTCGISLDAVIHVSRYFTKDVGNELHTRLIGHGVD